jgi:hypothetical protein
MVGTKQPGSPTARAARRPRGRYTQPRRLLQLYDRLHLGQRIHPTRLAEDLGVSRRTLERDLSVLGDVLGYRLERTMGTDGKVVYHLDRASTWPTTRWQVLAVAVGARMTGFLQGRRFAKEVSPLLSALLHSVRDGQRLDVEDLGRKIHVVDSGRKRYDLDEAKQERLAAMMDGLLLEHPVALSYHSPGARVAGRPPRALTTHPFSMVLHRGGVYFMVRVPEWGDEPILLSLDRIIEAKVEQDSPRFAVPADFDPGAYFASAFGIWTGDEAHQVRLRIDADYAPYVVERSWHPSQETSWDDQGRLVLTLHLGELREVEEWIMGMGEKAEVLEPETLRTQVRERHQAAADKMTAGVPGAT